MNQDLIDKLAEQAQKYADDWGKGESGWTDLFNSKFAQLVAAHEREKIVEWMNFKGYATGHGDTVEDLLKEIEWQIREREDNKKLLKRFANELIEFTGHREAVVWVARAYGVDMESKE